MKRTGVVSALLWVAFAWGASAEEITRPDYLDLKFAADSKTTVLDKLDELFTHIENGTLSDGLLGPTNLALTAEMLAELKTPALDDDPTAAPAIRQLINVYPVSANRYSLSVAQFDEETEPHPKIKMILHLIAEENADGVLFSLPLDYLTRHWKTKKVGRITYHYRDTLNVQRARLFDAKNAAIAKKLGVKPETFEFYLCENYQEILSLLGRPYDADSNGITRDGYGIVAGTIFSIMKNEDFSHDVFHYYSGQINDRADRNVIAEEGIAYSWGNAYYTDSSGEMIEQRALVAALRKHLTANPHTKLLELFEQNQKVFPSLAPEASALATLSSLICDEVERTHGMQGLIELITCGRNERFNRYFEATDRLVGINRSNFETRLRELIRDYK